MTDEGWYFEEFGGHTRLGVRVERVVLRERSPFQLVEILDTVRYGRVLALDGIFQTSEADEHYYHEMIAHPALVIAPAIERVLVIGGGDGGTAREVLRHDAVRGVTMVEIDAVVVEACKREMASIGTAWDDPRLDLVIGDGIAYVRDAPGESFDVIVLDGSDPVGPSEGLFNEAFYRDCARVLSPNGVFALQSESPFLMGDVFLEVQRTLARVFPSVHPYFGYSPIYGTGMWSWTLASNGVDPFAIDDARAEAVERDTRYYNRAIHRGAFALPNDLVEPPGGDPPARTP